MPSRLADMSHRQAALVAGGAYVVIIVLALFANFFVLGGLIESDDAAATVGNIADSEVLFRSGVAALVLTFVMDVVAAWGLYVFFQRTSRELSTLAAWFRVATAAISAVALLCLLVVLRLVGGEGYTAAFETDQRNAQVMLFLDAHVYGWTIGLVFFGFHLLLLGYLIVKSDYAPRILGVLVVVAGAGYVVIYLARILLPGYEDYENVAMGLLVLLAVPGEFGLTGWLLWRGGKPARQVTNA
jgi:hypothetical protein